MLIASPELGTMVKVAFINAMKLLNFFKPKPVKPTIDIYGVSTDIESEQIQALMEWLFASLMAANYFDKSHLIWYDSDKPDPSLKKVVKKVIRSGKPVFLYRCGSRVMPLPQGYYWRMMGEHPSMRIYQLEIKDDD
ncbi:hypothetical protein [Nodularia sphaerocarpa]|uniref:hypothetical protein n=1 Tax=Nodularia sphaerocarpa TaxID=137816 RepID=UPI00232BC3F2|nr:hypothetical protein [Nodularia sphaerocarpa]MDB9372339.1 hypothetical protein [Nodularia sphaerocarpa CS-585]MDB9377955.1 hypothetical protein [Nodularia sphaerocarpa CS-585A2]